MKQSSIIKHNVGDDIVNKIKGHYDTNITLITVKIQTANFLIKTFEFPKAAQFWIVHVPAYMTHLIIYKMLNKFHMMRLITAKFRCIPHY